MEKTRKSLENAEVGDILLIMSWRNKHLSKVTRVTKAYVYTSDTIKYSKKTGNCYGSANYYACIATEEEIKQITSERKRTKLIVNIQSTNFKNFPTEVLEEIYSIIQKNKKQG